MTSVQNIVGKNMRAFRKVYGETQADIAKFLDVEQHTISQYETGKRTLDRDFCQKLANRYRISLDEFLNRDFSMCEDINISIDVSKAKRYIQETYPLFSTEEAMKNTAFKKCYDGLMKTMSKPLEEITYDELWDYVEKFENIYCESELIEAEANSMSLFLLYALKFQNAQYEEIENCIRSKGKLDNKDLKFILPDKEADDSARKKFAEENYASIMESIGILKSHSDWAELGDYYLAMAYITGTIYNEYSMGQNYSIGAELMNALCMLDNRYAEVFTGVTTDYIKID